MTAPNSGRSPQRANGSGDPSSDLLWTARQPGMNGAHHPAEYQQGRRGGGPSTLRLVWIYPDLLSTYGDRGNLIMLVRRAVLRGLRVEPVEVNSDQPVPTQGDIYLLGGGEGEPVDGLGILDISSGRGERRGVGEILADVDPTLRVEQLTGFENHQGVTRLGPGARPLARLIIGVGNGDGTEGAHAGRVLGTYLHGPALVRNPGLADLLLSWAAGPLPPLPEADETWTRRLQI